MGQHGILSYNQLDTLLLGLTLALYHVRAPQSEPNSVLLEPAPLESHGISSHTWIFERAQIIVHLQDLCPYGGFLVTELDMVIVSLLWSILNLAPFGLILL